MTQVKDVLSEFERYGAQLLRLLDEIPEGILWQKPQGLPNSIGTIARHLAGNLNHYLGAGVLQNGYVRNRDYEFAGPPMPRDRLIIGLKDALAIANSAISSIDEKRAAAPHATPCGENYDSLAYHIIRLTTHFSYHVGEAYYATKLLASNSS